MKHKKDTVDVKILNYIEKDNLLDNFKNLEIIECFKLTNIYSDSKRQHFIFSKYRTYLFSFNGFSHEISIPLKEEIDSKFAYIEEEPKKYRDSKSILNFLKNDIYDNRNLVPFLSILLGIDADKLCKNNFMSNVENTIKKK